MSIADMAGRVAGGRTKQGSFLGQGCLVTAQDAQQNHVGRDQPDQPDQASCLTRYVAARKPRPPCYVRTCDPAPACPLLLFHSSAAPPPFPRTLVAASPKRKRVPEMCLTGGRTCILAYTRHSGTIIILHLPRYLLYQVFQLINSICSLEFGQ